MEKDIQKLMVERIIFSFSPSLQDAAVPVPIPVPAAVPGPAANPAGPERRGGYLLFG